MSIEFTHVPTTSRQHLPQYLDVTACDLATRPATRLAVENAFRNVVIDGPAGILTNMDVAAEAARATSTVGIVLTHWSGVMHPVAAARQIAALDRISGGRLSLRFLVGPDGSTRGDLIPAAGHAESLRQTDEYLVLLKRLWANKQPFDHEGPHYSVREGFVRNKGPQGADIQIRMGGTSGVAIDVAARHATVFELAAAGPGVTRDLMRRVETASARYGRAGRVRFALKVLFAEQPQARQSTEEDRPLLLSEPAAGIAQVLLGYASLGITEFMLSGVDTPDALARFSQDVAPLLKPTLPFPASRREPDFSGPGAQSWAS